MSLKNAEVRQRKDQVLGITVDQYIRTVSPVSSSIIAKQYPSDVSSATIRNTLAELEAEGFLTHPHTSAGRVPTQKGYRYYVDNLMNEIQLLEDEKKRIKAEYEQQSLELNALLENTSRVLSDTTHYTSIISVDGWNNKLIYSGASFVVEHPDFQDNIQKIRDILVALEEKERLLEVINQDLKKKVKVYIGQEIACKKICDCSIVVSRYKSKEGVSGRIAILGPTRMNYNRVVSTLDYFSELLEEFLR